MSFVWGGNRDHVPACLCYMLYYVAKSKKCNLAFFIAKLMEFVTIQARLILPYGKLLTRLFKYVMGESSELFNESYVLYDCVMYPLTTQQERKTRKDYGTKRGRHSTSSSSAFSQPYSSHLNNDDDDGNDKGTSRASTPSPTCFINSLTNKVNWERPQELVEKHEEEPSFPLFLSSASSSNPSTMDSTQASYSHGFKKIKLTIIPLKQLFVDLANDDENLTTPSPTTTSSSPTPPNAPSKTTSINETSSSQENTSSSFQSKLKISPPSSNEPTSPQPLNSLLNNISSNPQPLQSHPSLDITLSLSPFENLETPSPPSPPQPQPPIMGHPLYYNYHDYHGSTCICCSHNRNLFLTLRDEMNIVFTHL
ncbi:hypothetical protein Tco_1289748, partial [Tanacetum coccineum]